jgi:hypothetical protein
MFGNARANARASYVISPVRSATRAPSHPARMHNNPHTTPLCQLVRIILNSTSSTSSPASWRVSFPPSAERRHTRSSYRHHHFHLLPPPSVLPPRVAPRESIPQTTKLQCRSLDRHGKNYVRPDWHCASPEATCSRVMTASVQTPSVAARFSRAWKLTTASQFKWNGCTCGSAYEVGGGGFRRDYGEPCHETHM